MSAVVNYFHLGPPKTASTWLYSCLKQHPEISAPKNDSVRFFDNLYHLGFTWYDDQFPERRGTPVTFDATPSYIWSWNALCRILDYNPSARMSVCIRNPIDRAFSHYWHVKKKALVGWSFDEVLSNANTYALFIEPGFVADKIEYLRKRTSQDRIHIMMFSEIAASPERELQKVFHFLGVDEQFIPQDASRLVNPAGPKHNVLRRALNKVGRILYGEDFQDRTETSRFARMLSGKRQYLAGIDPAMRRRLAAVYRTEIEKLTRITGRDLQRWLDGT